MASRQPVSVPCLAFEVDRLAGANGEEADLCFGLELHPGKTRVIEFGRNAARARAARGAGNAQTAVPTKKGEGIDSMPTELDELTRRVMRLEIEEAALAEIAAEAQPVREESRQTWGSRSRFAACLGYVVEAE